MQTDLDDSDDMPLDAESSQDLDENLDEGGDAEASIDTEDVISEDTDDDVDAETLESTANARAKKEDIIHSDARRAIEALRESRELKHELDDELDFFEMDENYGS